MNLLENPGLEGGWTRTTHTGQEFGEIFVPDWLHLKETCDGHGRSSVVHLLRQ